MNDKNKLPNGIDLSDKALLVIIIVSSLLSFLFSVLNGAGHGSLVFFYVFKYLGLILGIVSGLMGLKLYKYQSWFPPFGIVNCIICVIIFMALRLNSST